MMLHPRFRVCETNGENRSGTRLTPSSRTEGDWELVSEADVKGNPTYPLRFTSNP
jgi:hypothetical protein